jgi:hypothetical protein
MKGFTAYHAPCRKQPAAAAICVANVFAVLHIVLFLAGQGC